MELFRSVWFGPFDETVLCDFLIGCPHRGSTNEQATSWSIREECQISYFKARLMLYKMMKGWGKFHHASHPISQMIYRFQQQKRFRDRVKRPSKNVVIKASSVADNTQTKSIVDP